MPLSLRLLGAATFCAAGLLAQTTTRETVSSAGVQGSSGANRPRLSADGRFACFTSPSIQLVANDTNGAADVFVHDRQSGQTTRVSVDSAGVQANGACGQSDISADGRFVVFESSATNLVVGDTNGRQDIFCHDRQTGTTTRVSLGAAGQQALQHCHQGTVSADGRFVAFQTADNALVPSDTCLGIDVFLRDRQAGTTAWVSASLTTGQTFNHRQNPRISDDGDTVVFDSTADDLVATDGNGLNDVFAWSRPTGAITLVSLATGGAQGNWASLEAAVSADGRFVVFASGATNFGGGTGPGNANGYDVFVRDRLANQTTCVSVSSAGVAATDSVQGGSITDDGRFVAFWSGATNLVPSDTNAVFDCFLHDRQTAVTTRVSLSASGLQARGQSSEPFVAGNGRYVTFSSSATNVVIPDTNGTADIFVRDLEATATALAYGSSCAGTSPIPAQAEGIGQPFVGNTAFRVGVCNAFPSVQALLGLSVTSASILVGTCELGLGGSIVLVDAGFTNNLGFASASLPIPPSPGLTGAVVYGQYLVLDPNGLFLDLGQLSQALAITVN